MLFLFILAYSTTANGYDYDFWARLIAGKGFVQTGHVLKQDFLSYTPTHTWFDHEWGSGVIFYLTQHFFSSAGIILLQSLLVFLIFFVITKIVDLRGVKTTSAYNFVFYFFAFSAMAPILNEPIRCQLFTFLFFTIFLYILELARKGNNRYLWSMPALMILWNNLHAGCVSGIGLIIIYMVGELLNKKPVKHYILPLILTIMVLPINPWGFSYLKFLLSATTMQRPDVLEWWGLFSKYHMFHYTNFKFFALILLVAEGAYLIKQDDFKKFNFDKTKFLVLLVTLLLSMQHVKLIPLAVIAITCFLYDDFYTIFNGITKNVFNESPKFKNTLVYGFVFLFAFITIGTNPFGPLLNWDKYPIRAIEFIKINSLKGNLLINFGQGSYASYKLYPNNKIFMDGRYEEVYFKYMVPMLKRFYLAQDNWKDVLIKYPPDVMVIEKYYPIYQVLLQNVDWKPVFLDKYFVVFVRAQDVKKQYKNPSTDLNYYKETLFETNIFK